MIETESDIQVLAPAERQDLAALLEQIWRLYFSDLPKVNEVRIGYSYPWKSRLALIRLSLDQRVTFIGINALLQSPSIPEYVLLITIAHELTHYSQGFGSPFSRNCRYAHTEQCADRELERRNLGAQLRSYNVWIDKYWRSFYDEQREMGWTGLPGHGGTRASGVSLKAI